MIAQCPVSLPKWKLCLYQQKTLEIFKLHFSRSALFPMNTRVSPKYFVNYCSYYYNLQLSQFINILYFLKKKLQKLIFNGILAISGTSLFGTQPLNLRKAPLKNLILPCLERSLSRITGKEDLKPFFQSLSHVIWVHKCYLVLNFEKTTHLAPFSAAYFLLIDFLKILQFTFS